MAVDANVIIFARIREEIATGKTVNSSMKIGFKKAMSAILDGNITTIIAALVLIALGSGTVKGFAYTLMIGIVLSMFTALVVTRWILYSFYAIGIRDEKFYGRAKERRTLNFLGKRGVFFTVSLAMIAAGFIGMGVHAAKGSGALTVSYTHLDVYKRQFTKRQRAASHIAEKRRLSGGSMRCGKSAGALQTDGRAVVPRTGAMRFRSVPGDGFWRV